MNIDDFDDGFEGWHKSEILQIANCSTLEVYLRKEEDSIADLMDGKMLIIENVTELKLNEFLVGDDPGIAERGSVRRIFT